METCLEDFAPWDPLIEGFACASCRAVVIIPARNEEESICDTLDALASQVDLDGVPLARDSFEILLLFNNCTDRSTHVATGWKRQHDAFQLHIIDRSFPSSQAFVGTARRLLMDTAWRRLQRRSTICGILSTDADTLVAQDWVVQNLAALQSGADAVGGVIEIREEDWKLLTPGVREAYLWDRKYQRLVAELEDRLDPQEGDPWPRHLEHFGASLACTPEIYARAGGMPAVTPLEDVAFVGRLRRVGARLRHQRLVRVVTSARMSGRVKVGLSGQLRLWQGMTERHEEHRVESAAWLSHRFRALGRLRREAAASGVAAADYLAQVDCDRRIEESFCGEREGEITCVTRTLSEMLANSPTAFPQFSPGDPGGNHPPADA